MQQQVIGQQHIIKRSFRGFQFRVCSLLMADFLAISLGSNTMASVQTGQENLKLWSCFMKAKSFAFALFLILLSSLAIAGPTQCPQHYFGGQAPDFLNEKLATKTQQVCYSGYGLIHSGVTRTPLTSAEHLTRERVTTPRPERQNAFHADPNIIAGRSC
jgi:hypothetical protein